MSTSKRYYRSYNWLRQEYLIKKKKPEQIAKECEVSQVVIYKWLHKFGFIKNN